MFLFFLICFSFQCLLKFFKFDIIATLKKTFFPHLLPPTPASPSLVFPTLLAMSMGYVFREKERKRNFHEKERERHIYWLTPSCPLLWIKSSTWAHTLTRSQPLNSQAMGWCSTTWATSAKAVYIAPSLLLTGIIRRGFMPVTENPYCILFESNG